MIRATFALTAAMQLLASGAAALSIAVDPVYCEPGDGRAYTLDVDFGDGVFGLRIEAPPGASGQSGALTHCPSGEMLVMDGSSAQMGSRDAAIQFLIDAVTGPQSYTLRQIGERLEDSGVRTRIETIDPDSCLCQN